MLINEYRDSRKEYLVACTECDGMVERWRETEKEAVEQWNRRVNNERLKATNWIPVSDMPNCCGYTVLLTVENEFGQREVCKAFTNYMKEGKQLFYTNEKEFCAELTSSKLSEAWKPIAWMHLPEAYKED